MVFVIFYKSATIEKKIIKICDAFAARRYPVPDLDDHARYVVLLPIHSPNQPNHSSFQPLRSPLSKRTTHPPTQTNKTA